jgi:hypothetical protein
LLALLGIVFATRQKDEKGGSGEKEKFRWIDSEDREIAACSNDDDDGWSDGVGSIMSDMLKGSPFDVVVEASPHLRPL